MQVKLSELEKFVVTNPELKRGCIVDTNVIFATSYPLDSFNEWGEEVFKTLHRLHIPVYTNQNVRSEFIDLNRRVLIPEGLVDLYETKADTLHATIVAKLKSLKTRKRKTENEEKSFKLSDSEINKFAEILGIYVAPTGEDSWTLFCRDFFAEYIMEVWDRAIKDMKINFLGTREIETKEFFDRHPSWGNMLKIVAYSGIGSADAMIINLFQESKLMLLVTADKAVKKTVLNNEIKGKYVLSP